MTAPNKRLAIAIPTFNRSVTLIENLRAMLAQLQEYQIGVHISDDSTNDDTEHLVRDLLLEYPHIYFRRNAPSLGHDANFRATVTMPDTDFVWYLGDSRRVLPNGIGAVLRMLDSAPDFCFVNHHVEDFSDREIAPEDMHQFLLDRTWYLTLTGATIYGRRPLGLLAELEDLDFRRNFPQLELILTFAERAAARAVWCGTPYVSTAPGMGASSYWLKRAFSVFMRDWTQLIRAHPGLFSPEEMVHVIRTHSVHSGLFGLRGLIFLRAIGALDSDVLQEYAAEFPVASQVNIRLAALIARLPRGPLSLSRKALRSIIGKSSRE